MAAVSRMIDAKTKSRIELTTAVFKNEMEYLDKWFDKYMTRLEKLIEGILNKEKPEPKRMGFGD